MNEEDRILALDMYSDIFDDVANENAALQLLVSPTRQAVNLARAYDAGERSFRDYGEGKPAFVEVIEDLRRQASNIAPVLPKVDDDQISLFEEPDAADAMFDDLKLDTAPTRTADEVSARFPDHYDRFPDEDKSAEPAPPAYPRNEPVTEPEPDPKPEVDEFSDAVEAFLKDFAIREEQAKEEPAYPARFDKAVKEPLPAREPLAPQIMDKRDEDETAPAVQQSVPTPRRARQEVKAEPEDLPPLTTKKLSIPLLILFVLIAVPLTLFCIGVLLVPTVLLLGLAAAALCTGISGLVAAFSSFSVFADMLLVFGLALALAAVGLLLLWLFVWMLVSVIPGLVRWVCDLGRRVCYREVAI